MKNPIEQQFGMVDTSTTDKKEKSVEKPTDLELAGQFKEKIDKKVQGRSLKNLTQEELNVVLAGYQNIKKALGIAEKKFDDQTIQATTPEGEPIEFNLEHILDNTKALYNSLNLPEWANDLPETIELTEETIEKIKEKVEKHGFNKIRAFPSVETQNKTLEKLGNETTSSIKELDDSEQYSDDGLWLSDTVKSKFPNEIKNTNRPEGKCYIQLYKDDREVPNETLDKTYPEAREYQEKNNLQGYTLSEYLIFQREFTQENKKHPDHEYWTFLTDSEIGGSGSSRVLSSRWAPAARQINVYFFGSDFHIALVGFRSSVVLSI